MPPERQDAPAKPARPEASCMCPASTCPLIAAKGSPWTGSKAEECPEHDDKAQGGCPWWSVACSTGGIRRQVEQARANNGRVLVVGPNKPRPGISTARWFACPHAEVCSWQKQAGDKLCPPRQAMMWGMDPRVSLF